ncbi:hypothetical protein HDU79_001542, partial [Rhizoclosmatium sp. JEL0117]
MIPLAARKHISVILELDKSNPKQHGRMEIVWTLFEAMAKGYNPGIFNYQFCHSQFNYAVLENIRGMAAHYACPKPIFNWWEELYSKYASATRHILGRGFGNMDDDNDDVEQSMNQSKSVT